MKSSCEMKGFLTFLILWMISRKPVTGSEISLEIEKRKGNKPSPGTIYPVLKDLSNKGLIKSDKGKKYSITNRGKKELDIELKTFLTTFKDIEDMKKCCRENF